MKHKLIIEAVSIATDIPIESMMGRSRKKEIVQARHNAMVLMLNLTKLSLNEIGESLGNRHHSSVIHARESVSNQCETDKEYNKTFERCKFKSKQLIKKWELTEYQKIFSVVDCRVLLGLIRI